MKIPIELSLRWIPQNRTTEGKNTNPPKKKKNTSRLTLPQETGEGFVKDQRNVQQSPSSRDKTKFHGWLSKRTTFQLQYYTSYFNPFDTEMRNERLPYVLLVLGRQLDCANFQ